jgi:ATP-dependent Clp protease protease subunit
MNFKLFRLEGAEKENLTSEEIEAAPKDGEEIATTAIMRIYEEIGENFWGDGGITAKKFSEELDALNGVKRLNVHINSLGGDTFTAQAIYSILSDFEAKKTAYIDGVAASAATIIACAADEVIARENSNYMIHLPWMIAIGNAETMRKAAEDLDAVTEPVVNVYRTQVNGKIDDEKIMKLMEDETWLTAEKALEYGFVDKIRGKIRAISRAGNMIMCSGRALDLSKYGYRHVPNYPKAKFSKKNKVEEPSTKTKGPQVIMTKEEIDPALLAEIESSACKNERERLVALDAMNPRNDATLAAIIKKAKDEGKQPSDIALECFNVAQEQLGRTNAQSAFARDGAAAASVPAGSAPRAKILSKQEQAKQRVSSQIARAFADMRRPPPGMAAAAPVQQPVANNNNGH